MLFLRFAVTISSNRTSHFRFSGTGGFKAQRTLKWMSENRQDCAALERRRYGMATRGLASRRLNTGSHSAIWSRKLQDLGPIAYLTVVVWLSSCDANLFGPESREIAGGYRLKRANNPNEFALTIPNEDGGLIIDEIGWREPLIFARAFGSQYWDVINTARAQHIRVSDLRRKSDPISQSIQIKSAEIAWKELNRHKRLW